MEPLNAVAAQMYMSEVRELIASLLILLEDLAAARVEWLEDRATARSQADAKRHSDFDRETFHRALQGSGQQQAKIFATLEAALAAWARLSLLFYPLNGSGQTGQWREVRGDVLREVAGLPEATLLENRSFRDSWMHFDERMDLAVQHGWLGNRQEFVHTSQVPSAVERSVRVIDVETLTLHYRTRTGAIESVRVEDMRRVLEDLQRSMDGSGERILKRLPMPPRGNASVE